MKRGYRRRDRENERGRTDGKESMCVRGGTERDRDRERERGGEIERDR